MQLARTREEIWHPQSGEVKKEDEIRGNVQHCAVEEAEQISREHLPGYVYVCATHACCKSDLRTAR